MNKGELVSAVAEKAGLTKVDAKKALEAVLDVVKEELTKGNEVALIGFGTFKVAEQPAREGVNPRDPKGPKIQIPARKVAKFRPGAELKEL